MHHYLSRGVTVVAVMTSAVAATVRENGIGQGTHGSSSVEPEKLLRMKVYDQTTDPFASPQTRAQAAKQIAAVAVALGEPQVR